MLPSELKRLITGFLILAIFAGSGAFFASGILASRENGLKTTGESSLLGQLPGISQNAFVSHSNKCTIRKSV